MAVIVNGQRFLEADDVQEALSVYFAGHNLPSVSSIGGGQQLDEVLDQVDKTLLQELGDVNAQIEELITGSYPVSQYLYSAQ